MSYKKIKTKIFLIGCVLGISFLLLFSMNPGNTSSDLQMVCEVPVFMFNNDSDQNTGEPDHSDKVINSPNDLLDLTPIIIRQKPGLSLSGKCCVSISEPAREYVQLFYKSGENYVYIENKEKQELPIDLLRDSDIELRIEANIKTIKQETAVPGDHIIRIPALFEKKYEYAPSLMPNMVNAAYMNGHIFMADPKGPIFEGEDLIQKYVSQLLRKEDVIVHFIDDLPYHKWSGNVHCATNVTYQPHEIAWWE